MLVSISIAFITDAAVVDKVLLSLLVLLVLAVIVVVMVVVEVMFCWCY